MCILDTAVCLQPVDIIADLLGCMVAYMLVLAYTENLFFADVAGIASCVGFFKDSTITKTFKKEHLRINKPISILWNEFWGRLEALLGVTHDFDSTRNQSIFYLFPFFY